jgi:hypothetical protein
MRFFIDKLLNIVNNSLKINNIRTTSTLAKNPANPHHAYEGSTGIFAFLVNMNYTIPTQKGLGNAEL